MKRLKVGLIGMAAGIFLTACALTAPTIAPPESIGQQVSKPESSEQQESPGLLPASPPEERVTPPPGSPERKDHDLFFAGIALLHRPDQTDPAPARAAFAELVERHPESRWRPAAETVLRLIDDGEAVRRTVGQERLLRERSEAERSRALQENEQLKKTVRELTGRLQTATAALSQENEQLKKNLERLKKLEIELEKRERMLR